MKWQELFDVVVVGAKKPAYLLDSYLSLFHVDETGRLRNIEDKDSLHLDDLKSKGESSELPRRLLARPPPYVGSTTR